MKKRLFAIEDQNSSALIVETKYYAWLLVNALDDVHTINTKLKYLSSTGFDVSKHRISSEDLATLNSIEQFYVRMVLVPMWDEKQIVK